jgi:hypothetical protein
MAKKVTGIELIKLYCKKLLAYNVTALTLEYDGSGDSGDFGSGTVTISPDCAQINKPTTEIDYADQQTIDAITRSRHVSWDKFIEARRAEKNPVITAEMCDEISDAAFDLLPGGWEINDGSFGSIIIDTANETISVEHNERYTEVRSETFNY